MRMNSYDLTNFAKRQANDAQKPVLEKLLSTGFVVTKVLTSKTQAKCAICVSHPNVTGWLTADGVFHRPIKGKKRVSVSRITLDRVW